MTLTAIAYYFLGLYSLESAQLLTMFVASVIIGIPAGAFIIRHIEAATFRRVCMSFDACVVGFGLSRTLMEVGLVAAPMAYAVLAAAALINSCLLYWFLKTRSARQPEFVAASRVPIP